MKSFVILVMLAFFGKNGVVPSDYGPSAGQQAAVKRVDWSLACSVPREVLVSYSSSSLAERSLDSICMSVRFLQNSKYQYRDVYSDSSVPLATVVQVLYDYVTAVVEGDVRESAGQRGSFNLDIVSVKPGDLAVTCREPGYKNGNQDIELPANSSFSDIVQSANFIRQHFNICE